MRVFQINGNLAYGDGIGNHVYLSKKHIAEMGYKTEIYCQSEADKRWPSGTAKKISEMPRLRDNDAVVYHFSHGTQLNREWIKWPGIKIMCYHNVTPPEFFQDFDLSISSRAESALEDAIAIKDQVDYIFCFSEYSKCDLAKMGYELGTISIMPSCFIPFDDYAKKPNINTISKYSDGFTNIVFIGRLSPNKKQEDITRAFAEYKLSYNSKSRLILAGNPYLKTYSDALKKYVDALGVSDVVFTSHISFAELCAIYKIADVFLCMSEHEGFCIPLVEAMHFGVPVVAYSSTAVSETVGSGGVLLKDKNPLLAAGVINKLLSDDKLREKAILSGKTRLRDFSPQIIHRWLENYLRNIESSTLNGF
jgi:glycosyltransferase involved in cell wall biosynthesis